MPNFFYLNRYNKTPTNSFVFDLPFIHWFSVGWKQKILGERFWYDWNMFCIVHCCSIQSQFALFFIKMYNSNGVYNVVCFAGNCLKITNLWSRLMNSIKFFNELIEFSVKSVLHSKLHCNCHKLEWLMIDLKQ